MSGTNRFEAYDLSLTLVRSLREPLRRLRSQDGDLARQLRRAAASVPLNLSEGSRRLGKDRTHHFRIAAGSADEIRACLQVSEALGYLAVPEQLLELLDRLLAMTYRLSH